jgi:hypothetical protein
MVVKYKPLHKLSALNLRAGLLRADNGAMNIPVLRSCIPSHDAPWRREAEYLAGAKAYGLGSAIRLSVQSAYFERARIKHS